MFSPDYCMAALHMLSGLCWNSFTIHHRWRHSVKFFTCLQTLICHHFICLIKYSFLNVQTPDYVSAAVEMLYIVLCWTAVVCTSVQGCFDAGVVYLKSNATVLIGLAFAIGIMMVSILFT
jgi:hypothetical protein